MYPEAYPTDRCKFCCREAADQKHIFWDHIKQPEERVSRTIPPRLEEAARSYTYEHQHRVVRQVLGAKGMRIASRQWRADVSCE